MSELKEHDVMPSANDRSYLSKRSGTEKTALIAPLKWFELVHDDGTPTERLENFIAADEQESKTLLKEMVESSYRAITDGTLNLRCATTSQLA
ncbi:hypothetical protein, partial [Stenotrophomonas sp. GbtcB23]|uniref:hypothetical protein n=1 Tax=Stenotrophomonas sp. GbtcB23 TaxID=2824768 RepID=UPI001C2FD9DD